MAVPDFRNLLDLLHAIDQGPLSGSHDLKRFTWSPSTVEGNFIYFDNSDSERLARAAVHLDQQDVKAVIAFPDGGASAICDDGSALIGLRPRVVDTKGECETFDLFCYIYSNDPRFLVWGSLTSDDMATTIDQYLLVPKLSEDLKAESLKCGLNDFEAEEDLPLLQITQRRLGWALTLLLYLNAIPPDHPDWDAHQIP